MRRRGSDERRGEEQFPPKPRVKGMTRRYDSHIVE